jgi:aminopeptidase 2
MATTRLPTSLRPVHYDLVVRTDLDPDRLSFDGFVKIELEVLETTSMIVLNAASSLTLGAASVISTAIEHGPEQYDAYRSYDTSLERVTLHFTNFLEAGSTVILRLGFNAKLESVSNGLYYATSIISGKPVHYSMTMFEVGAYVSTLFPPPNIIPPLLASRGSQGLPVLGRAIAEEHVHHQSYLPS